MTNEEIDELAMRSYAADGAQTNPMDWGRAFRAGIAALQRRQAEQAAACPDCGGDGYYKGPRLGDEPCPKCSGTGKVQGNVEQTAAGFKAWDRRYEQERLDCGPTAKALQMTVEKPQAAWQAAAHAAEAREAARAAEFRRRVTEAIREQPLHMDVVGALVHAMDLFNEIFAAERPGE